MMLTLLFTLLLQAPPPGVYAYNDPNILNPIITQKFEPKYPESAMKIKLQGYVVLQAVLKKDGTIKATKVLRGLGRGKIGFEDAAMKAVETWQFKPGVRDGKPVDVAMVLKIDFVLQDYQLLHSS